MGDSKEATVTKLMNMTDIDIDTNKSFPSNNPYFNDSIYWRFKGKNDFGEIYFYEGKTASIHLAFLEKVNLRDLFAKFGEPDKVLIEKQRMDGIYYEVSFFYLNKGICLRYQPSIFPFMDLDTLRIKSSTKIGEIYFIDPDISDWQLVYGSQFGRSYDHFEQLIKDWSGFGSYKVLELVVN